MAEQTDKMNYCCDCGWAVKKGLFRKTWHCTNPQKNEAFGSHVFHPVTCKPMIKTPIACDVARFMGKEVAAEQHAVNLKHPCPYYKGQLRGNPAIPPRKKPNPIPPLPERSEKATQAHDAACLMNQKQKELEAENKFLKEAKEELLEQMKMTCWVYHGDAFEQNCFKKQNRSKMKMTCWVYHGDAGCLECSEKCKGGKNWDCSVFRTIQKYDGKDGNK